MSGSLTVAFIEEKIRDLKNALFFSVSDAVLKIPTSVINVLEMDELAQLWFVIPKPTQSIHAFDKSFLAKLDFFRKGRDYFLKINGRAFIVSDPEEINREEWMGDCTREQVRKNELVLVRVRILHAEYVERDPDKTLLGQVKSKLHHWFRVTQEEGRIYSQKTLVRTMFSYPDSFSSLSGNRN
jgi:general stress protein 26